ncbi:sensor histidine kinase [Paenibacillus cymbidii]|uniref:sensor histidine kinase n=1 Tax=Paenibacillus cymbidii TaxID=1639034 RepID=UPI001080F8BB|nr:histidine kinase [Paenibacillus cymbidii]
MKRPTLRLRLLRGFVIIIAPLALFLYYENYYAMKVVREEVSQSTSNALAIHVAQIDTVLQDTADYLLRQIANGNNHAEFEALSDYPADDGHYILAKVRLHADMVEGGGTLKNIHALFVYSADNNDFVISQTTYLQTMELRDMLEKRFRHPEDVQFSSWQLFDGDEQHYLVRVERVTPSVYAGAVFLPDDLIIPLRKLDYGDQWKAILLGMGGQPLTDAAAAEETMAAVNRKLISNPAAYQVFKNEGDGTKYLLVSTPFSQAPLSLAAMIPEKHLLRQLPFFQRVIFCIPVGVVIALYFYSLFLRNVLFTPVNALMKGIRRVMKGEMEIGVQETKTEELNFLIQTFNDMVSQMKHLKINAYEEMLKAQQSEFKHLQAQINPHFYLNSLNVINSLSILEENGLVCKMTEHLSDYFRFITRSHRDTVTLEEELQHIRNYLEIQSLRFPERLTYRIEVEEQLQHQPILPLLIQPFVENAVIHGMEEGSRFHIEIIVERHRETMVRNRYEVLIRDDGRGLAPDILQALTEKKFGDGTGTHMGVWNVYRRMRMVYGDRAELSFRNRAPKGAIVQLDLPAGDIDSQS